MSQFFKPAPQLPEPGANPYSPPSWTGPDEYSVGALIVTGDILARSNDVVVALDAIRVHTNGFEIHLIVACKEPISRGPFASGVAPWDTSSPDALRLGYEFSDGRCAGDVLGSPWEVPRSDEGFPYLPIIVLGGSATGSHSFVVRGWCWPLPPPGTMTIVMEWLAADIRESSLKLDAERILTAVPRVLRLW